MLHYIRLKIIFLFILITFFPFISCNRVLLKTLKSSEKEIVLKKARDFEETKKYDEALQLYDHLISIGVDSNLKKEIDYKRAWISYKDENYILAASLFKGYHSAYPFHEKAQEALFQSAYCHFLLSQEYNLDQKETYKAMDELQAFITYYPESEKLKEVNKYINELETKLEKKAFFLAKNYYDIRKYKEAVIAFENFMSDFPRSTFKVKAFFYKLKSQVEFAKASSEVFKEERKIKALSIYKKFKEYYPDSDLLKKAFGLLKKLKVSLNDLESLDG